MVTDNSNFILDWKFPENEDYSQKWDQINTQLMMMPGGNNT